VNDSKRVQDEFGYWAILSRMAGILSTADHLLDIPRERLKEKLKLELMRSFEEYRSEWLQMPDLGKSELPGVAEEYKALIEEWKRLERKIQEWQLREIPAVGSS
jgi:hypothetical protein